MLTDFVLGLDLGQAGDPTAISVLEEPLWLTEETRWHLNQAAGGWVWPRDLQPDWLDRIRADWRAAPEKPPLRMPHLERLPLGTSYVEVVRHVKALLARPPLATSRTALVIDFTGVGRPVYDLFVEAGLRPIGITVTGGNDVHPDDAGYRVPKRDLVAAAQAVLQSGRLRIAEALPDAQTLRNELISFKIRVNIKTGHDQYGEWRNGKHDDLVLSAAMAIWYREFLSWHYDRAAGAA